MLIDNVFLIGVGSFPLCCAAARLRLPAELCSSLPCAPGAPWQVGHVHLHVFWVLFFIDKEIWKGIQVSLPCPKNKSRGHGVISVKSLVTLWKWWKITRKKDTERLCMGSCAAIISLGSFATLAKLLICKPKVPWMWFLPFAKTGINHESLCLKQQLPCSSTSYLCSAGAGLAFRPQEAAQMAHEHPPRSPIRSSLHHLSCHWQTRLSMWMRALGISFLKLEKWWTFFSCLIIDLKRTPE